MGKRNKDLEPGELCCKYRPRVGPWRLFCIGKFKTKLHIVWCCPRALKTDCFRFVAEQKVTIAIEVWGDVVKISSKLILCDPVLNHLVTTLFYKALILQAQEIRC